MSKIFPMPSRAARIALLQARQPDRPLHHSILRQHGLLRAPPPDHHRWCRPIQGGGGTQSDAAAPPAPAAHVRLRAPVIGAALDLTGPAIGWHHPVLQRRFQPMPGVQVAALSCDGLGSLARPFGLSFNKISTIAADAPDNLRERMRVLAADRYGSIWIDADGRAHREVGFDDWRVNTFPDVAEGSPFRPLRVRLRTIDVRLPYGVTHSDFDQALTMALSSARIDVWAATDQGRAWCRHRKQQSERLRRFTDYLMGGAQPDRSPATEIVAFMPRLQLSLLVAVIEEVSLRLAGWQGPPPQ